MYLTTVKELGTALLTKGTAFALTQTATQTNNSSVNDVLDSAQEVTASTADEVNRFVQYFNDNNYIIYCFFTIKSIIKNAKLLSDSDLYNVDSYELDIIEKALQKYEDKKSEL